MNELEHPGPLWPRLVLFGAGALVVLWIVGAVIGAVLAVVRMAVIVAIAAAVIWAVVASRR